MKILNLYAGLGGNSNLWDDTNHQIVNIELEPKIAEVLQQRKPNQQVIIADFRNMPHADNSFKMVVFDPPHLNKLGKSSWMAKKYGILSLNWKEDLRRGFKECFRVLEPNGTLIFKWNESQIKVNEILKLTDYKPMFGHISGKRSDTHWICFIKL